MPKKVKKEKLQKLLTDLFCAAGMGGQDSKTVAGCLVANSLRGIDSHGLRLAPHYLRALAIGRINAQPQFKFAKKTSCSYVLDADHGHGIIAGTAAMEKAIATAKKYGNGVVFVKNSTHFAAAGTYSLMAAAKGMIGLSLTNTDALMVPFGAQTPFLGTNPIAFAAPVMGQENFCLDMATTVSSWNNILIHRLLRKKLSAGWAVDKSGRPTVNQEAAAGLLPIGGYKGYGLSLMVEILCSCLTNMPYGPQIKTMYPVAKDKRQLGHFFMALDIAKIIPLNTFKRRLTWLLTDLRKQKPNNDKQTVLVAGDKENASFRLRSKTGIPVTKNILDELRRLSEQYGIRYNL